jgi:hypothetical protein
LRQPIAALDNDKDFVAKAVNTIELAPDYRTTPDTSPQPTGVCRDGGLAANGRLHL